MTELAAVAGDLIPAFHVDVQPAREHVVVVPVGELDLATVQVLDDHVRALLDAGFDSLVLDLRRLEFIDSRGLQFVVSLALEQRERYRLQLRPGPPAVQRVFELAGIARELPFGPARPIPPALSA